MRYLLWIVTLLGALGAGFTGFEAIGSALSAPQLAAQMALCLWMVAVPYCAARAWDELTRDGRPSKPDDFSGGG